MHLATFIRQHADEIITEWESFARSLVGTENGMAAGSLKDHIGEILDFIAADLETAQTPTEQVGKSRGEKPASNYPTAAQIHASKRFDSGFDITQMVAEYRALRASVIKLWEASSPDASLSHVRDVTRFHEAIDQALSESIADYSKKMALSRDLFLGILSHDLRNPLGAIVMSAELTLRIGNLDARQRMLQTQISDSARRANEIVENLLDLTRSRLGSGLPIVREPMNMGLVCRRLIDEMRVLHPNREFQLMISGDVSGMWDDARMGQVLSNLLGNAVQYGFRGTPILVKVEGTAHEVHLSVHNEGMPIPPEVQRTIFSAMTRALSNEDTKSRPIASNLGLGLYITRQIATAHGGRVQVSSDATGTTFTVRLPRLTSLDPTLASSEKSANA